MENLPQFKLVIELINNIIVFDKDSKVLFAGDAIKNTLNEAGVHFEELFQKNYSVDSEEAQMKETLERKFNIDYIKQQYDLNPHPKELMLLNHV